jgi:hypothetical protein
MCILRTNTQVIYLFFFLAGIHYGKIGVASLVAHGLSQTITAWSDPVLGASFSLN